MKKNKYKQKRLEKKLLELINSLLIKGISIDLDNKKKDIIKKQYLELINLSIDSLNELTDFIKNESDIVNGKSKIEQLKKSHEEYLKLFGK